MGRKMTDIKNRVYELIEQGVNESEVTVYIPSKNRAGFTKTNRWLEKTGKTNYVFVVEPQDEVAYREALPDAKILVLDANDKGIAYARTLIKKYSTFIGEEFHWQIDDDMTGISFRLDLKKDKKKIRHDQSGFSIAEILLKEYPNIGAVGIQNESFEFSRKKPALVNTQVAGMVCFRNDTGVFWDETVIEDTDYSLQLLYKNYCTVTITSHAFLTLPQMRLKGGNTDEFISGGLHSRQVALMNKYPGKFAFKPDGKLKPSRIWKTFNQRPEHTYDFDPFETLT